MEPGLQDGDLALGRGPTRFRPPRVGDVVLIRHPQLGLTVKRLIPGQGGRFGLRGDGGGSAPSVDLGQVTPGQVLAILRWRFRAGWPARIR